MELTAPIGVFDSGIGGLTVFRQLRKILPGENIIYFGDTRRNPYGPRSEGEILEFVGEILDFMRLHQVKIAVSACNTITVLLEKLQPQDYPFKVVGMSRGILMAMAATNTKRIGVLATETTIRSGKHVAEAIERNSAIKVFPIACPKFAPLVEAECLEGAAVNEAADNYVMPLKDAHVDAVILACTHYPMLEPVIRKVLGPGCIIDPAEETALEVKCILEQAKLLNPGTEGYSQLYFSAGVERAKRMAEKIMDTGNCKFSLADVEKPQKTTAGSFKGVS